MTSTKTKYTVSEAHRIAGKSRTTIAVHMKSGKLSSDEDASGNKLIDASELIRVYGDDCDFDRADPSRQSADKSKQPPPNKSDAGVQTELTTVQQLLNTERSERQREREQLQARIDHLEDALKLAQEGHNRATLLLENRTDGVGDWNQSFRTLEARIANQEEQSRKAHQEIKQQSKRHVDRYKRALEEEKNKPLWQKLFR